MKKKRKERQQYLIIGVFILLALIASYIIINLFARNGITTHSVDTAYALDVPDEDEVIRMGNPGVVVESRDDLIENALVEKIHLFSPENGRSQKSLMRHGKLIRYKNAAGTIVICHGFMTDKSDVGFLRNLFPQGKFNILTFDFRAHGECAEGQQCTFGKNEALDVITAVNFLKQYKPLQNKPILAYGFSMGSVSALQAQARDNTLFKAMIVDCPFDSSSAIINRALDSVKLSFFGYQFNVPARTLLQKYAFHPYVQAGIRTMLRSASMLSSRDMDIQMYPINTARAAQKITVPCFFIHCRNDELVQVDSVKKIYNEIGSSYKMLWLTNGRRHYDSFFYNPEEYVKRVRLFVDNVITGKIEQQKKDQIMEDSSEESSNEEII